MVPQELLELQVDVVKQEPLGTLDHLLWVSKLHSCQMEQLIKYCKMRQRWKS